MARAKTVYDQLFLERNYNMLEHFILLGMIQSHQFYRSIKGRVAPLLPDGLSRRPDFENPQFNRVFNIIATHWDVFGTNIEILGHNDVDLILAKQVETSYLAFEEAKAISAWLLPDVETIIIDPQFLRNLPNLPVFLKWLEARALNYEHNRLSAVALGHTPTMSDWRESMTRVQQSVTAPDSRFIRAGSIMERKSTPNVALHSGFQRLDERCNGFWLRDTTLVAAVSGGGKTVMAMQLAGNFATIQRVNTLVLTTEQPPEELLRRLLSNHLKIPHRKFLAHLDRSTSEASCTMSQVDIPYLPPECTATPGILGHTQILKKFLDDHLMFLDWSSGGFNFEQHFDAEIEQALASRRDINGRSWEPKVVIVDWVGGGINHDTTKALDLRHYYKAAGEVIIRHGKAHNRHMFMMAQLAKDKANRQRPWVDMDQLAECKSLVDNATNMVGITSLRAVAGKKGAALNPMQFLCVSKARKGSTDSIDVRAEFEYQRFVEGKHGLPGGSSGDCE